MDLIFSEGYIHKNVSFRFSLLHEKGKYILRIFREQKFCAEFETNLNNEQAREITLSTQITRPLEEVLEIGKKWIAQNCE